MKSIGVIGAGQMGRGIAQSAAENGFTVMIYNHNANRALQAIQSLHNNWQRAIEKGKITLEVMEQRVGLLSQAIHLEDFEQTDLIIEAIVEDVDEKKKYFKALDKICSDKSIFVSNTSSLPITEIASFTDRPEKVAGMHFFNPVPVMKLVEIVRGEKSSEETLATLMETARKLNKVPILTKDTPGFIVNRLVIQLCNEAIKAVEAGVASPQDIDTAMKLGMNWPMGPFELTDMAGLDLHINAAESLAKGLGDDHYGCPQLVRDMVRANQLGRKTGKGFYEY